MKYKKLLPAALLILLPVFLCSVFFFNSQHGSAQTEDEAFSAFTRELFRNEISNDALTLHYTLAHPESYGITDTPDAFAFYSQEAYAGSAAALENTLDMLSSFSRQELSEENRLTYDILKVQLQNELALAPYSYYEEIFSPTLGTQAQLPILLAEYTFDTEQDIENYLSLLSQLDAYYDSLLKYQQEKSEAGLFMSDETADAVIAQCRDFLSAPSENFLLSTFEERLQDLDFLSEEDKNAYIASNRVQVFGHVLPAYELLIEGLSALEGTGTNACGLYYYPQGREYYEALAACTIGTGRSMEEIRSLIDAQLLADLQVISEIIGNNPALLTDAAQNIDTLEPLYILETLEQKIQEDFPAVAAAAYEVKYVDPALAEYLSPAFYLTPPLDQMSDHVIYINPSGNYTGLSLFTTLAHEGYPGHLYQTLYENSRNLDPVRSLFYFGGYIEGWATYAERYSYFYTSLEPDMAAILSANSSVSLGLYARADVGIHYDGWTLEDAADFFSGYGIEDSGTVHAIYQAIVQDPGNYLKYYLGALEIQKLKEQANAALSDQFVLKDFHEFILSMGPSPFPVLEAYLTDWVDCKKSF